MASKQLKRMNELYASIKERLSKPDIGLATIRDIVENLHLAATEPEAVTYAEVDADGVPALWCIPVNCDPDRVLLHSHAGGPSSPRCTPTERLLGTSPRWWESAPLC
jgi:epsilon-lactone hydrolase